jgi:ectoine hydroxylase-related dioxygenase (phytanoyl-CoA dioxygenase family)
VGALAFLDDFGPDNGATRLIPASHRPNAEEAARSEHDESQVIQIAGQAGDILVFDVDLLHAASLNPSGAHRRSLLINYAAEGLYDAHQQTAALRQVRMDTSARYAPGDFVLASA